MTWQVPNSSDSWPSLPPSPPMADSPTVPSMPTLPPSPPAPPSGPSVFAEPTPPRPRRRTGLALAACLAGFAIGVSGTAAVAHFEGSGSPTPLAASATTLPATSLPATTLPGTTGQGATPTTPSTGRTPAPTVTSPSTPASPAPDPTTPSAASSQSDLTVGLVNVDTVLAYQQAEAAGTGIVLSSNGEILTNNHVIEGATKITVTVVATGKTYTAKVVGTDATDDIAVLDLVNASGLAVAPLGDSSTLKVGDAVVGIGNAGGRGVPTSSSGAVVDLGQTITATDDTGANAETLHNLIEISAQLQPGQSGGPLYDAAGKIVGIDAAGSTSSGRFRMRTAANTGYSIPINDALTIAHEIDKDAASGNASSGITLGTPPMLGIGATNATTPLAGVMVTNVATGTPAEQLGLQAGDVITAVGNTPVSSVADLTQALKAHKAGDSVTVTWSSGGVTHSATAATIAGPAD